MSSNPFQSGGNRPGKGRFQFGVATLLFLAIPIALLAGAWSVLTRSKPGEPLFWIGFAMVAAAPMALTFLVSLYQKLRK